ncbi:protocadherin Fat 4-like [Saccostrea echinata]|uniref:protocadherin Fat 4-like n=1 Tax=Saccostrea echinata TaxID=191078 RepID=UPI002A83AC54|nr:protocadherin Fat 4-like [Saccostrea echinata]
MAKVSTEYRITSLKQKESANTAPDCNPTTRLVTISETVTPATTVVSLGCVDTDTGADGTLTCSIISGNGEAAWELGTSCDLKTVTQPDFDFGTRSYSLGIRVADGGSPSLTSDVTINIEVLSANDNVPVFTGVPYTVTVPENQATNVMMLGIAVTDDDILLINGNDEVQGYKITITGGTGADKFFIGDMAGLYLRKSLDYEVTQSHNLTIVVTDQGLLPQQQATSNILVTVQDINDNTPKCTNSYVFLSISEDQKATSVLTTLTCTDADSGASGTLTYSIVSGNAAGAFDVQNNAGNYYRRTFEYKLRATDGGTPQLSSDVTIDIEISSVNEMTPTFHQTTPSVDVSESMSVGTLLYQLTVQDTDKIDSANAQTTVSSIQASADSSKFSINPSTASMYLKEPLDFEVAQTHTITVQVVDQGISPQKMSTATLTVNVLNANDKAPVCSASYFALTLTESTAVDSQLQDISCSDVDAGALTYTITAGNALDKFKIVGQLLKLKSQIDADTEAIQYRLITEVADAGPAPALTTTVTIDVYITGIDDNVPLWETPTNGAYTATLPENSAAGTFVQMISATDADLAGTFDAEVTYKIEDVNSLFGIESKSGRIYLARDGVDREVLDNYVISVSAHSSNQIASKILGTVAVTVTDINDNSPTFSQSTYHVTVPENTAINTGIITVTAQDPDLGTNGQISYAITSVAMTFPAATDNDAGVDGSIVYSLTTHTDAFAIKSTTKEIVPIRPLDREALSTYELVLVAVDQAKVNRKTGTATMTVSVQDVNEYPPDCAISAEVTGSPPFTIGSNIYTMVCSDHDAPGPNGAIVYSITAGNTNTDFRVETDGRVVYNKLPSDVNYQLTIVASDSAVTPLSTTVFLHITLQSDPLFTNMPGTVSIDETSPLGASVFDVLGSSASGFKSFSIISGNADNKFKINSYTGNVFIFSALDRETTSLYTLSIRITDINLSKTADSTLTITVLDNNDNAPKFGSSFYETSVVENIGVGTLIQDLVAIDNDEAGPNSAVTYAIVSGNAESKFEIDTSGKLKLKAALDAETTTVYMLTVTATDSGTPQLTGTTIVLLQVTNFNEFQTEFLTTGGAYSHSLSENTALGTLVFSVTAQDLDVGSQITYAITLGNDNSFAIDPQSGNIFLTKFLDRETTPTYSLTISANNGQGEVKDAVLALTITDVNDNDPTFSQNVYSTQVIENYPVGGSVLKVTCTDADSSVNSDVTLSIVAGNTVNAFRITGDVIEVNSVLDYETINKYVLLIEGKDKGIPSRSSTATVDIEITPVYPQPRFASNVQTTTIPENTVVGTTVFDSDATIGGALENKDLAYTITAGNSEGKFAVNENTGELSVIGILDRDTTASYDVTISAVNIQQTTLRDLITVTVTLSDINDNKPIFSVPKYSFTISETSSINTIVGVLTASDKDTGANSVLSFSIISGENSADFAIDPSTGQLQVNSVLNAPLRSYYALIVQAADGGTPSLTSKAEVDITVIDINDNSPIFSPAVVSIKVNEILNISSAVYSVYATDADSGANARLTYSILSGNNDLRFSVDPNNGKVLLRNLLDRETVNLYSLVIIAVDAGSPAKTGSLTLSIEVVDANDNSPYFIGEPYSVTLGRADPVGTYLISINGNDTDLADNAVVEYFIVSGDVSDTFYLNKDTGRVTTLTSLVSSPDTYSLVIHAIDRGVPKRTSSTSLAVRIDPPTSPTISDFSFTVDENVPMDTSIGTVLPDPIHNPGTTIIYTILSGNYNNNLKIGLNNGVVKVARALDHEERSSYYLTIKIQDSINSALVYNKNVHVTVNDLNDNTPLFQSTTITFTNVVENSPVGLTIGQVPATDADSGLNGQLTYEIDPSDTTALSALSITSTGHLTLSISPDYESSPRIAFVVYAKDQGTPSLTGTVNVVIDLIDVYDNPRSASANSDSPFYSLECPITAQNGDVIVTIKATDFGYTVGATDSIRFKLIGGGTVFDVGATNGNLYVKDHTKLFAETRYFFSMSVRIQTSNNNVTATSALFRVDTMTPRSHMVILTHSISKTTVESQK